MLDQKTEASDFNLIKITTAKLEKHIETSIKMGENVFILGQRGTGKTSIVEQQVAKANCELEFVNLSTFERTDLGGFPRVLDVSTEDFIEYKLPKLYKKMMTGDKPVVLLLDELDKADISVQNPLLEVINNKSINGIKLKNLQCVIMTGNLIAEGGSKPSAALLDRSECYLVQADAQSYIKYASRPGSEVHPTVVSFLTDHMAELQGDVDPADRYKDQSPRGWSAVSRIIYKGEILNISKDIILEKICGRIGKKAGVKFQTYFDYYQSLVPLINNVYNGKVQETIYALKNLSHTETIILAMSVADRYVAVLDSGKDFSDYTVCFSKFFGALAKELALIIIKTQVGRDRIVKHKLISTGALKELMQEIHAGHENDAVED